MGRKRSIARETTLSREVALKIHFEGHRKNSSVRGSEYPMTMMSRASAKWVAARRQTGAIAS
jgi:hypothetical protein